jgi:hypothetical protein
LCNGESKDILEKVFFARLANDEALDERACSSVMAVRFLQSFRAIMYITHDICNLYDFELKELKAWLFDRYADNVRCDTSVHK